MNAIGSFTIRHNTIGSKILSCSFNSEFRPNWLFPRADPVKWLRISLRKSLMATLLTFPASVLRMGFHRHYIVEVTDGDAAAALRRLDEIDLQLEAILGKPTSVVHLEGKLDGRMVRHGGGRTSPDYRIQT